MQIHNIRALLVTGITLAILCLTALTADAASTIAGTAGWDSADHGVHAVLFLPSTITVDVGDTVTWNLGGYEPHTVTFGTPSFPPNSDQVFAAAGGTSYDGSAFTSSGLLVPPAAIPGSKGYSLTFTKAGTYAYMCLLHQSMQGTVVVHAAGTAYPAAQASYKPTGDPAVVAALQTGAALQAAQKVTTTTNPDGTKTYAMNVGTGDGKTVVDLRFGASSLTIHTGDSVTWTQPDPNEIHTVTFLDNGKDVPFVLPDPKTGFTTNPVAAAPAGGKVYSGTGYFNSGILVPVGLPPQAGPNSYTLTFAKAGTYQYQCLVHDIPQGMKGTIQVVNTIPRSLPSTGGLPEVALVLGGLLGLVLIGGGFAVYRRSGSTPS